MIIPFCYSKLPTLPLSVFSSVCPCFYTQTAFPAKPKFILSTKTGSFGHRNHGNVSMAPSSDHYFIHFFSKLYECLAQYSPMRISPSSCLYFILYFWACFSIHISVVSGHCLEDQQLLLLQLRNSLRFNSASSSKLVFWNQSLPCCDWKGVTCDEKGHVTGLDLSEESISDGFDDSSTLFNLQYLQNLNLAFNNFSSVIPSEIQKLKNLTSLNLSYAGLVGQVPIGISQLTRLVTLDISSLSYLTGHKVELESTNLLKLVQNLTSIRQLYLNGVSISAQGQQWCNALMSLPSLEELSMSSCNLSGPIDSCLTQLENLSVIHLDQNNLSSAVPETFANFRNLTTLSLSSCGLRGIFPQKIFQVGTLSAIDVSDNNELQGSLPNFPLKGSLRTLIVSYTNFSGKIPTSIGNLRHLSRLDLSKCQLNGEVPSSLSNITKLTYLDLSNNSFNGPIPSFDMLKNLTYVDLSYNNLSGAIMSTHFEGLLNLVNLNLRDNVLHGHIPSSLFSLPLLQKIQLSLNHFDGQMDEFSTMSSSKLDTLDLSNNNLEGLIPRYVFKLKRLNVLQLSSNKFSGIINLDMIQSLRNLTTLDISRNNLSIDANGMDANLSSFPNLSSLKLASCRLREFPMFIQNQSRLVFLDLSNNQIQGLIPKWIWKPSFLIQLNLSSNSLMGFEGCLLNLTTNLRVLDLHFNKLQGQTPIFPPSITYLDYSSNKFNSAIPFEVGNYLSSTIFLSLKKNNFYGSIPHSLCKASNLQVLDLSNNNFEGKIPKCLTQSEMLVVLNLQNNSLNGNIPDTFPESCALKTLDLRRNQLSGLIPKSLSYCMALEVLNLGNNHINDLYPCLLKKISTLRVMVLRKNKFQGHIGCPHTPGIWPKLQIVDLAFNNFNGSLPRRCFTTWKAMMLDEDQVVSDSKHIQFPVLRYGQVYYQDSVTVTVKGLEMEVVKILTIFTSVDFSSNKLEGQIPEELMNFTSLYVLNLSNNALTGQIPKSIGKLKNLESLDLSSNSFMGEIPTQLANLSFLSVLNLSFNHLVGRIPEDTQLQSFEASSFVGNEGLCGPPSIQNCGSNRSALPKVVHMNSGVELDWQFVFTGVGFGVGSGLIVASLMFLDKGRKWSNNSIDKILLLILPMVGLVYTPMGDDEAEDDTEEQESDMEEDYDHNNEEACNFGYPNFRGEYCVFCSKLDISMKKAIHDPSCTCHHSPSISTSSSSSESDSS